VFPRHRTPHRRASPASARFARRAAVGVLIILWLAGAASGLRALASYAVNGSTPGQGVQSWPPTSAIPRHTTAASLVLFVHPKCPCSAATLGELSRLLARAPHDCQTTIAFGAPVSEAPDWGLTQLRDHAARLPRVRLFDDVDAREANLFGAVHSGHVFAFDRDGNLRFSGGITASRGHEGDNAGRDSALAALLGRSPATDRTPVYGCRLVSPDRCAACQAETAR
jgi:hypothetical protein